MKKTNPIGVRFRQDVLEKLKVDHKVDTPQKALVFLEQFYVSHHSLAKEVTGPLRDEKKVLVQKVAGQRISELIPPIEVKHPLWKPGDPKEGSNGFYLRYGCSTYDELQELNNQSK